MEKAGAALPELMIPGSIGLTEKMDSNSAKSTPVVN